jgi:hypothetical protein
MGLPRELVLRVIQMADSPEDAANLLQEYECRRERVSHRDKKVEGIKKNAALKVAELMAEEICHHEITKCHSDPSGGSDRSEECLICGDWICDKLVRFT